jgi:hypothetical protein
VRHSVPISRSFKLVILTYLVVFGPRLAVCQHSENDSASIEASAISPQIHVNSDLVVVPVTVTDRKGRIVNGLQKEHFALYEDKVEQAITHFATEDTPVSISFVLDTSDSMQPKLAKAREAAAALLHNANPEDEFSLVEFNNFARLTVSFTTKVEKIRNRLAVVETGGGTALLDAVRVALNEMKNAHHTRKAIVIVSDGEDNASHCAMQCGKSIFWFTQSASSTGMSIPSPGRLRVSWAQHCSTKSLSSLGAGFSK